MVSSRKGDTWQTSHPARRLRVPQRAPQTLPAPSPRARARAVGRGRAARAARHVLELRRLAARPCAGVGRFPRSLHAGPRVWTGSEPAAQPGFGRASREP